MPCEGEQVQLVLISKYTLVQNVPILNWRSWEQAPFTLEIMDMIHATVIFHQVLSLMNLIEKYYPLIDLRWLPRVF